MEKEQQLELSSGIAAAFRHGLPIDFNRVKFSFVRELPGTLSFSCMLCSTFLVISLIGSPLWQKTILDQTLVWKEVQERKTGPLENEI
jgi:hypothetical protein